MSRPRVPRLRTQQAGASLPHAITALQDATRATTGNLGKIPLLDGRLITDVAVATTATSIPHKLGRQPLGWVLTDQDTAATVRRSAWDAKHLTLIASAACTVGLWVF